MHLSYSTKPPTSIRPTTVSVKWLLFVYDIYIYIWHDSWKGSCNNSRIAYCDQNSCQEFPIYINMSADRYFALWRNGFRMLSALALRIRHVAPKTRAASQKSAKQKCKKKNKDAERESTRKAERVWEREQCVNDMANPANNNNGANNWSPAKHDAAVD